MLPGSSLLMRDKKRRGTISTIEITNHKLPFALLEPVVGTKRHVTIMENVQSFEDLEPLFDACYNAGINAIDYETKGTRAYHDEDYPVGVGIANEHVCFYIDFTSTTVELVREIQRHVASIPGAIAHNAYFDGAWAYRDTGSHPRWKACTYGLFRQCATEGFEGQRWGLKYAMENLLLWESTNESDLDNWLIDNGYYKNIAKEEKGGYYYRERWEVGGKLEPRWVSPDKGKMYLAPPSILGHYCGLDAWSTYELYTKVFLPVLHRFPELAAYHERDYLLSVKLLTEQYLRGIRIDVQKLSNYHDQLNWEIETARNAFLTHKDVAPFVEEHNIKKQAEIFIKQPEKYKKVKEVSEPKKWTKSGRPSKNWIKWKERVDSGHYEPQVSKNWESWKERYENSKLVNHFNLNSGDQLRWLLYDCLGYEAKLFTDSGLAATGGKALTAMGEVGSLLARHDKLVKEQSYVAAYLDLVYKGRLHPSWRVPATLTGRLGGKEPNIQQVPKSRGVLTCFIPDDGNVFVDCDHKALEQVVMAELTNDNSLMKIYGPEAKPNDVYLFVGSQLPGIGNAIRSAGYDPDSPTIDGIAAAKKRCKRERSIAKVVVLASSYGAGARKIHQTLDLAGINIDLEEVYEIHSTYWQLFNGIKRYEKSLLREYRRPINRTSSKSQGYVLNGIGRPIGIAADYLKDIVNRVVQSTGHDIHMKWIRHIHDLLTERDILWYPLIWDFHDQTILEVPKEMAATIEQLYFDAYDRLNEEIGGIIDISGEPMTVPTLAECKLEG